MKLFISYSLDDKAWTYELWRQLRDELHHDAWIDKRLVAADDWWGAICENIKTCDVFLYIMSPKSVESIYCGGELDYAIALNKPILPLMLKPCYFPQSLRKRRVQYQTITDNLSMDRVLLKVKMGLMAIQNRDYPPQDAPRPDVPKPGKDPEHIFEVFAIAEEVAAKDNITLAQELFGQVIAADPDGLGAAAKERMDEIAIERDRATVYANVKRLANNPITIRGAKAAWRAFQRTYSGYDPDGLAAVLEKQATPKPATPKPKPTTKIETPHKMPLPPPFAWIEVPAGKVELGKGWDDNAHSAGKTFDVPAFAIAKYPLTNAQFAPFIEAGGYRERKWWTDAGWKLCESDIWILPGYWSGSWTEPGYWRDSEWNGAEQPVVGVSWYEAITYCQWLSEQTGQKILLPTEQQWQRAAQGDDGRDYPWGSQWDAIRCQNSVGNNRSGVTSPVTQYEGKGDSPFGVVDMAGNMWEWCLTEYMSGSISINGTETRVLRGGSWGHTDSDDFRCGYRYWNHPDVRYDDGGFRLALSY